MKIGFFLIIFWKVMDEICDRLIYFTKDYLLFNSKTLCFYCLYVSITIAYTIALIFEFIELQ